MTDSWLAALSGLMQGAAGFPKGLQEADTNALIQRRLDTQAAAEAETERKNRAQEALNAPVPVSTLYKTLGLPVPESVTPEHMIPPTLAGHAFPAIMGVENTRAQREQMQQMFEGMQGLTKRPPLPSPTVPSTVPTADILREQLPPSPTQPLQDVGILPPTAKLRTTLGFSGRYGPHMNVTEAEQPKSAIDDWVPVVTNNKYPRLASVPLAEQARVIQDARKAMREHNAQQIVLNVGEKAKATNEAVVSPKEWTNIGFGKDAPPNLQGKVLSEAPGLLGIGRADLFKNYGAVDLTTVGGIKDIAETEVRTRAALSHIDLIQRAWDKAKPFFPRTAEDLKGLTEAQISQLYRRWQSVAPDELAALQNLKTADLNIISATVPPRGGRFGLGLLYFANSGNPADFANQPWTQTSGDAALKQWRNAVVERWQAGGGRALPGRIPEAGAISGAAHAAPAPTTGIDVNSILQRAKELQRGR